MHSIDRPTNQVEHSGLGRLFKILILFGVVGLLFLRFVNLDADFPPGITKSAVLYTDEGWYSAAAVRDVLTGDWYVPGDINMAVTMPAGQVFYRVVFALLKPSLASARMMIAFSFLLLTLLTSLLVRRHFGDYAALLTALVLAGNYVAFAYSRLATMDLIATSLIVASLWVADGPPGRGATTRMLAGSAMLTVGILAKNNAVLGLPLLAYLGWRTGTTRQERVRMLAAACVIPLVLVGAYVAYSLSAFPAEWALYQGYGDNLVYSSLQAWYANLAGAFVLMRRLGIGLVRLVGITAAAALIVSRRYRDDLLIHVFLGYILVYGLMLSVNSYRPVRYYLPLLVPLAGLLGAACVVIWDTVRHTRGDAIAVVPLLVLAVIVAGGARQIRGYLLRPTYSFFNMAHSVGGVIQAREGRVHGVLLFGDIADSVSLEIGTNSANSLLGLDQVAQLRRYHPEYLIVHTSDINDLAAAEGATVQQLGAWDVFGNYYANGEQVRLYSARWPGQAEP